jgi:DNA replication initiation complex subunit (GINS family)
MYDELYAAWRLEIENGGLGSLPTDFYARIADYLRHLKEENKTIETKGVKTTLLAREMSNATQMANELILARYRKLVKMLVAGQKVPVDSLPSEERKLYSGISPSAEAYNKFAAGILEGQLMRINVESTAGETEAPLVHTRVTLRFVKAVPSIIGADMKSYGPFLVEDVASVPLENAKILIKQGLAKAVELQ